MKPVIGVTPHFVLNGDEIGVKPGYLAVLESVGAIPLMLPLATEPDDVDRLLDRVDGVLLTGGIDVNPELYGEEPLPQTQPAYAPLDQLESILVPAALERDMPVLGICRGMQMINVCLGGTLYQDLLTQHPGGHQHDMEPPFDEPWHTASLVAGSPLHELLDQDTLGVNSKHHQAVRKLAEGLEVDAYSDDDLVEAFHMPERRFVRGVQWHPELMWKSHGEQQAILRDFVDACRQKA